MGKKRSTRGQSQRKPRRKVTVSGSKRPVAAQAKEFKELHIQWKLANLDFRGHQKGGFGWARMTLQEAEGLLGRLQQWEAMKWKEVLHPHTGSHFVDVEDCSKEALSRLRSLKLDDIDKLLSLRVNAKARVWGIVRAGIFHFLWWDPEHRVCPSKKKHT